MSQKPGTTQANAGELVTLQVSLCGNK